jgi:peptide/nickel transport system substrate-binding protein
VVFTWNEVMFSPQVNQDSHGLFQNNGRNPSVTKVDDLTVRMVTPEIFAPFLELFGNALILPEHTFGPSVRQRRFRFAYAIDAPRERIVGSGPFRLKESQPGKSVLLERNPEYWAVDTQKRRLPYFDEVLITASTSSEVAAHILNGKSDVYDHGRPEDYAQFKQAAGAGKFNLVDVGLATERDFIWFNLNTNRNFLGQPLVHPTKLAWFQNKKFRQAISCAIDRDRIVREVFGGRGKPIHAFATEEDGKWNNLNVPRYGYDLARAKSLLAEAGIQDRDGDGAMEDASGTKVAFTFNSNLGNPIRERCALFITEDLNKLGLKVDFQLLQFTNLVERIGRTFDYDCILMGLGSGGSDPASQTFVLKSSGPLHQWFPYQRSPATEWEARIDALMDVQMSTLDFATRKKAYDEIQMILAEEMPMIHTAAPIHFAAARSDLANLRPSVFTPYRLTWNIEELYFKTAGSTIAP